MSIIGDVFELWGSIGVRMDGLDEGLRQLDQRLNDAAGRVESKMSGVAKGFESAGKKMDKVGKNLTKTVTAPIMGIAAAAVKVGMEFESAMADVKAVVHKSSDDIEADMKRLDDQAQELGRSTKYSASQVAQGMALRISAVTRKLVA